MKIVEIPHSHRYLIDGPYNVIFTTVLPSGYPHTSVIWCNSDKNDILINTMEGFQKERNMRRNDLVTLLIYEKNNPLKNIEIRGTGIEMTKEGAMEHIDELSVLYTGKGPYFGEVLPIEHSKKEFPVMCRIKPSRVLIN